ncbi:MAG: DUF3179 domain-containing protein [Planctomycetia bacterium]|nr:DUF3179 domain-containing protein [Planctomycetia bacterium]
MDHESRMSCPGVVKSNTSDVRAAVRQRRKAMLSLLVLLIICLLRFNSDYDFRRTAWTQQMVRPDREQDESLVQVAFQRQGHGFDLRNATIPVKQIVGGGPPKDGIPALTNPKQVAVSEATFLQPADRVIGVAIGDVARAYPLRILDYHEIVNDRIGELPIAVTYCPLCDSAVVFDRRTKLGEREFGVSGLLFNSNVLMYDRGGQPESLWAQLKAEGVSGPAARIPLKTLPVELTTWKDWLARHPQSTVLALNTGHSRDYGRRLYAAYFGSPDLMFAVKPLDRRLAAKTPVLGVWTANAARAYPLSQFSDESRQLTEQLDGKAFVLQYDALSHNLRVTSADEDVQWMYSFWFAWAAFRPKTELYKLVETAR